MVQSSLPAWLFGYGSVIFRPSFPFVERVPATLVGFRRRFSQASDDHRGTPERPGRVVTLRAAPQARVRGAAFRLEASRTAEIFAGLDRREQAGYAPERVCVRCDDGRSLDAVTYVARPGNPWDCGDEPLEAVAARIAEARGPSGSNAAYLFGLEDALCELGEDDPHVAALAALVRAIAPAGKT